MILAMLWKIWAAAAIAVIGWVVLWLVIFEIKEFVQSIEVRGRHGQE